MPKKPKTPCLHPGCPELVEPGTKYCEKHKKLHPAEPLRERGANERGYGYAWQKARKAFLAAHPLCVMCQKEGKYVKATVVDHIIPHRGDKKLFWDSSNWQSLCEHHHNLKTGNEDRYVQYEY